MIGSVLDTGVVSTGVCGAAGAVPGAGSMGVDEVAGAVPGAGGGSRC